MAQAATVRGVDVKLRNPWGTFGLLIVTIGIYHLFWYYRVNRELRDYGGSAGGVPNPLEVSPGVAVLATTLGWYLIVPPFVSEWRFFRRIGRAQELAGMHDPISHVTGFLLWLLGAILFPIETIYAQTHLNRLWEHELAEEQARRIGIRGETPLRA
jgi:hypothetical protein